MTGHQSRLGDYLRQRRSEIDPAALGLLRGARRTPGLRREEVALRADISPAWYTCLEQGRGGAASADVLNRLASALMLTDVEREHMFLLALGHPPQVRYCVGDAVAPRLQRLLDALLFSPAVVRTATWDILAWNQAAAMVLTDYGRLAPDRRNVLRLLFCNPGTCPNQPDGEGQARAVVAAFRLEAARAGAAAEVAPMVDELCASSPTFAALWSEQQVKSAEGIIKRIYHPALGTITLEYSCLAIDGRPDLSMVVWNPVTDRDGQALQALASLPDETLLSG